MAPFTRTGKREGGSPRARRRGFTLIELLAVVTIISLLAVMAIPQYQNAIQRSREAALKQNLYLLRSLIDQYFADKGHYPDSLETLVSDGYLRSVPVDPFTNSSATWQTIQADPSKLTDMDQPPGIFDVKSGAQSPYSDW